MSITACNFIGATREEDANGFAIYMALYELFTNDRGDGVVALGTYTGLPFQGAAFQTPYETDLSAILIGRRFSLREDQKDSAKIWRAELKYSNDPGQLPNRDPEDPPSLPWSEPPDIELYAAKDKEAMLFDLDGYLVASSAGEPYDPVQERDATKYLLRISRNQLFVDPYANAVYKDAINTDPFFGCDPYTVKVETPGAIKKLWFGTTAYYNETWEFAIDSNGHRLRVYDYGMYRKVGTGATAKLEVLRDLHNQALTRPRLLDGNGGVLAIGSSPVYVKPAPITEPGRNWFKRYNERPFAALGLPFTI